VEAQFQAMLQKSRLIGSSVGPPVGWPIGVGSGSGIYNRSEGLPLRDMLSLGAWRMGLGCSGEILPSSPSSPPSSSSPATF
jgi:hypothetical protein